MKNEVCKKSLSGNHKIVSERADIADLPYYPSVWQRSENTIYRCAYCGIIDDERSYPNV